MTNPAAVQFAELVTQRTSLAIEMDEWPIVATHAGGIPEVVEEGVNGLLVRPRDHHALAEAIIGLINDPRRRQEMGEAGFARVNARFTVERMIAGTADVYARVAGRPHAEDTAHPPARD